MTAAMTTAGCVKDDPGSAGSTGGANGSGGTSSTGGRGAGTGGAGTGGAIGTGGTIGTGGVTSSGGTVGTGGAAGSGGAPGSGGAGGFVGSGGATGGGGAGGRGGSAGGAGGAGGTNAAALFSDDFEGAAIDARWTPRINGSGRFALDTTQKHGGSKSLHVTTNSGYSTLLAVEGSPVFPAPNNTFFGRVWFRVPTLPANAGGGGPHVIWLEAGNVANDTHEVRIGMNLGYLQTNLYFNGEVDLRDPAAVLMANLWQCIEFKMGPDELIVWLNGMQATGVSTTNWAMMGNGSNGGGAARMNWSPTYAAFRLGWELNAGVEIWYDDVALGHSRIGCN